MVESNSNVVFRVRNGNLIRSVKLLNSPVGFGARQAIPLLDLEPGPVGTWPAVSSTQRKNSEYSNIQ